MNDKQKIEDYTTVHFKTDLDAAKCSENEIREISDKISDHFIHLLKNERKFHPECFSKIIITASTIQLINAIYFVCDSSNIGIDRMWEIVINNMKESYDVLQQMKKEEEENAEKEKKYSEAL